MSGIINKMFFSTNITPPLSAPPLILGEADFNQQNCKLIDLYNLTPSLFLGRVGVGPFSEGAIVLFF